MESNLVSVTNYQYKFAFLWDWLTPVYDMVRWLGIRKKLQKKLWPLIKIKSNSKVLDVGCGTGDDLIYLATHYAGLKLYGVDGDSKVLAIAQKKSQKLSLKINYRVSLAEKLPFAANSFDVVWSSLMIHHLPTEYKKKAFQEMHRVLKPTGQFYLIEFSLVKNWWLRRLLFWQTLLEPVKDHYEGRMPQYLRSAGFRHLEERHLLATVSLFTAKKT